MASLCPVWPIDVHSSVISYDCLTVLHLTNANNNSWIYLQQSLCASLSILRGHLFFCYIKWPILSPVFVTETLHWILCFWQCYCRLTAAGSSNPYADFVLKGICNEYLTSWQAWDSILKNLIVWDWLHNILSIICHVQRWLRLSAAEPVDRYHSCIHLLVVLCKCIASIQEGMSCSF